MQEFNGYRKEEFSVKKVAAWLRSILLAITMITGLVMCVLHVDFETTSGALLLLVLFGAGALYLLVSIISLIVRMISRARMNETARMMDSYTGALVYLKNGNTIHYFRRLSFWGMIMLLVNIIAFNITSNMLIGGPYSPDAFLSGYHGYLLWSLIALAIAFILSLIFWAVFMPHYGEGTYNFFTYIGKLIVSDIMVPIRIIQSCFSSKKKDWIGLATMIAFIAVNVIAILKST